LKFKTGGFEVHSLLRMIAPKMFVNSWDFWVVYHFEKTRVIPSGVEFAQRTQRSRGISQLALKATHWDCS